MGVEYEPSELQSGPLRGVLIQVEGYYQKRHWWSRRFPVYLRPETLDDSFIATVVEKASTMRERYEDPEAPLTMLITPQTWEAIRK